MKRFFALFLTMAMVLSLAACGGKKESAEPAADKNESVSTETTNSDWPKKTINIYMTHGAGGDTDGYTFIATNTAALNGNEATGMVDFGYDAFEPVAVYGIQSGENIVVPADAPYDSLTDLIEASKATPGQIKFGISTGGGVYIQSCVLTNLGGAQFNIIDVGDGATRLTALLGGEVDATSLPYSTAADYIANGQLKSLCTCLSKAPDLLPDQKVASETIPELIIDTEYVLLAPKGTPAEIVEAMNAAVLEATSTDDWKTMVNNYCFQNPFVLNVEDTIANLTEQRNLFQSFVPFL